MIKERLSARKQMELILQEFPQILKDRATVCDCSKAKLSGNSVFLAEFHGPRVDDTREISAKLTHAFDKSSIPLRVELVRADWLPINKSGVVSRTAATKKYLKMCRERKRTLIENGTFSVLKEREKDAFSFFGSYSKIRTPVELTYPNHITIGNWVSLGRYGKVAMLPAEVYEQDTGAFAAQHYPELKNTYDFSKKCSGRTADLYLGDGTTLGDRYFIICTKSVRFGKHVMTAANLFVSDCHHIYENTEIPPALLPVTEGRPVIIEDHVWIGINCCILEGVRIGRHAVVAANSVVKDDVPPYTLVAGAPARVKKTFRPGFNKEL